MNYIFIRYLPFKEQKKVKVRKYQRYTFFTSILVFGYHGYKLSKRDFLKSKKKLLANPEFVINEPEQYTDNSD